MTNDGNFHKVTKRPGLEALSGGKFYGPLNRHRGICVARLTSALGGTLTAGQKALVSLAHDRAREKPAREPFKSSAAGQVLVVLRPEYRVPLWILAHAERVSPRAFLHWQFSG